MNVIQTEFQGLVIVESTVFEDTRGYFFESYNRQSWEKAGIRTVFVQDNQSFSHYGVIRGLHFQMPPYEQAKLIRVLEGVIFDVALDLRRGTPTFGKWFGVELSAENRRQLYIPRGFAHGFSVLSEQASVFYKCDNFYHPQAERGIRYNDLHLDIRWKIDDTQVVVSPKDLNLPAFDTSGNYFIFTL
ncbi:MAG: dTDP-4-dehydrorhamnose 3,5-epimerase [Bacteroidales bacterium]|jgi:dTDP-4-dehydrorhamnose 3,5-epimerase|nr:dTDP-4-dehydrorhamnose 3,5-epimerase [Bacteroidales bacterium]